MSKKKEINQSEGLGIDGWKMDVITEKNKLAPSQHAITCVFDKYTGISKFWTEFEFLSDLTPGEKKIYKTKKPPFKLMLSNAGAWYQLKVEHPTDPSIKYTSDKFYRRNAKTKYETDDIFKQWFDYAVELNITIRIVEGLFQTHSAKLIEPEDENIPLSSNDEISEILNSGISDENSQLATSELEEEPSRFQPINSYVISDGKGGGAMFENQETAESDLSDQIEQFNPEE